jgi:hypothetical protein
MCGQEKGRDRFSRQDKKCEKKKWVMVTRVKDCGATQPLYVLVGEQQPQAGSGVLLVAQGAQWASAH